MFLEIRLEVTFFLVIINHMYLFSVIQLVQKSHIKRSKELNELIHNLKSRIGKNILVEGYFLRRPSFMDHHFFHLTLFVLMSYMPHKYNLKYSPLFVAFILLNIFSIANFIKANKDAKKEEITKLIIKPR